MSKKVDTDSVLYTLAECYASTNSSDIPNVATLLELREYMGGHETFNVVGCAAEFSMTDYCYFNPYTKHVRIICSCMCNATNNSTALCRVPEKYIPSSNVLGLTHMVNGNQIANVGGIVLKSNGYVYQSLSGGLTSAVFELDYHL